MGIYQNNFLRIKISMYLKIIYFRDTLTLEQILQREGPMDRIGVTRNIDNEYVYNMSEESSDSNESDE